MKRTIKNVVMIILILLLGISIYFTMDYAKNHIGLLNKPAESNPGNLPQMPSDNSQNTNNMGSSQPPEKRDGENESNMSVTNGNMQPPNQNMPDMNQNNISSNLPNTQITAIYYVIFSLQSLIISALFIYLIMSCLNRKNLKETLNSSNKIIIYILAIILLTVSFTILEGYLTNEIFLNANIREQGPGNINANANNSSNTSRNATGNTQVDGEKQILSNSYTSENSDESAILVKNGGEATITDATVTKSSGDSTNTEDSEFYGMNAGILVTENSTASITGSKISTNAKGSNAIFATGTDSQIYISDSTINTIGSGSARGLDATYGGYIKANNVTITTQGNSCATLATDRGEGTVIAENSNLITNGSGSPVIYSTGDISISNTQGVANGSQMVVIEGKNSATVKNSTLYASGKGNRGDSDHAGVMIYQSMSGDASVGTGNFTSEDSTLTIQSDSDYYKVAPMFFITNTDAIINLANTKLVYGSNILINAKGTSEWGKSGSNGGNITLNATNQILTGNIEVDEISTLTMNLKESTTYKGTINENNSAKSISITLDETCKIVLTGDSYITSLEDADSSYGNIDFNGYTLYVNGKAIN